LSRWPSLGGGNGEHGTDCRWLEHRCEGLLEVDARALVEAAYHPPGLVPFQHAIRVELVFKHPLADDDMGTGWFVDVA
jgi:hypothetical protein